MTHVSCSTVDSRCCSRTRVLCCCALDTKPICTSYVGQRLLLPWINQFICGALWCCCRGYTSPQVGLCGVAAVDTPAHLWGFELLLLGIHQPICGALSCCCGGYTSPFVGDIVVAGLDTAGHIWTLVGSQGWGSQGYSGPQIWLREVAAGDTACRSRAQGDGS